MKKTTNKHLQTQTQTLTNTVVVKLLNNKFGYTDVYFTYLHIIFVQIIRNFRNVDIDGIITKAMILVITGEAYVCSNTFSSIFFEEENDSFLQDVFITFTDKTDLSNP